MDPLRGNHSIPTSSGLSSSEPRRRSMSPARQRVSPSTPELNHILGGAIASSHIRASRPFSATTYHHSERYSSHTSSPYRGAHVPSSSGVRVRGGRGVEMEHALDSASVGSAFSAPDMVAPSDGLDMSASAPSTTRLRPTLLSSSHSSSHSPTSASSHRTSVRSTYPSRGSAAAASNTNPPMRSSVVTTSASAAVAPLSAQPSPVVASSASPSASVAATRNSARNASARQAAALLSTPPASLAAELSPEQLRALISNLHAAHELATGGPSPSSSPTRTASTSPRPSSASPVVLAGELNRSAAVDSYEGPSVSSTTSSLGLQQTARYLSEQMDRFEEEIALARARESITPTTSDRPAAPEPGPHSRFQSLPRGTRPGVELAATPTRHVTTTTPNPDKMFDLLSPTRSQHSSAFSTPTSRQSQPSSSGRASPNHSPHIRATIIA